MPLYPLPTQPSVKLATGTSTSTTDNAVVATLAADTGKSFVSFVVAADVAASTTRLKLKLTYTDATTETLTPASGGVAARYVGDRSAWVDLAAGVANVYPANTTLGVSQIDVLVGAIAAAGTKTAFIAGVQT